MEKFTFTMTRDQADIVFKMLDGELAAHKNWIASQVEDGNLERAKELVRTMRKLEDLFRGFNIAKKEQIAAHRGVPLSTSIQID